MRWPLAHRFKSNKFARDVGTLATASLFAQLITLAASPILTRLYEPEIFAAYALFVAVFSVIAPAASGRYEIAIVVAKEPADGTRLFVLSVWVCSAVSLIMFFCFYVFYDLVESLLNSESLGYWLLFTPLALFLHAFLTAARYYANSLKDYKVIGISAVAKAAVMTAIMVACGWAGWNAAGLITGLLIGLGCATMYLVWRYREKLTGMEWSSFEEIRLVAKRYKDLPLYNATTSFLNALMTALPVFFLTRYYPESYVGYYSLLIRVALGPLSIVAQAVSQVHLKKVAELIHARGDAVTYLFKVAGSLIAIVLPPTIVILLFAPELFQFIFGSQWQTAGVLLVILMPALALRFVVSTVSGVFASTGNNHLAAIWRITAFLATFCMFVALAGKLQVYHLFLAMMITDMALYGLYFYLILVAVRHPREYVR